MHNTKSNHFKMYISVAQTITISRIFSSFQTETLYLLNSNSSFLLPAFSPDSGNLCTISVYEFACSRYWKNSFKVFVSLNG